MKLIPLALAGALAIAAGGASLAQPGPPPAPLQGDAGERHDPAQMAEHHAEHLRAALQLRPDQEPALRALLAATQPDAASMQRMQGEPRGRDGAEANLTTPQRLDRMQAMMAEHQARFGRMAEAVRRFYAQLTPPQQRAFDAMAPMMMHHGMGGHHGMGHGMGAGGPDHGM